MLLLLLILSLLGTQSYSQITGTVQWNNPTGIKTSKITYGLDAFHCFEPNIAGTPGNPTYKANLAVMGAGILRCHNGGQQGQSTATNAGWVDSPDTAQYSWDVKKITNALTGSYPYGPDIMLDIVNWPAYLDDGEGHLKKEYYQDYANFAAELVKIVNIDLKRNVTRWEVFNEKDGPYATQMEELGRIYILVSKALKKVDPTIKVGGPAFARPDLSDQVDQFFSVAFQDLDFVSYHTYSTGSTSTPNSAIWNSAYGLGGTTISVRRILSKYRSTSEVEFFHDEFNISWNPPDIRMNNEIGAVFDALALISITNSGATGSMAWNEADGWYGKLDNNFNRRPSSYLYQFFNEDMGNTVVVSNSSDISKVVLFGAYFAGTGRTWYHLCVVNRAEANVVLDLKMEGLPSGIKPSSVFDVKQVYTYGGRYSSVAYQDLLKGYTLEANTVTIFILDSGNL